MEMAKVTSKGQITIPISIRRKLEINEGDKILFIAKTDGVMMVNPDALQSGQLDELTKAETVSEKKPSSKPKQKSAKAKKTEKVKPAPAKSADVQATSEVQPIEPADAPAPPEVQEVKKQESVQDQTAVTAPSPPPAKISNESAKKVAGLDLGSLLDDIRSIGSNISNH